MLHRKRINLDQCNINFKSSHTCQFEGIASIFDGNDAYDDTIKKGAFAKTINGDRPPMMYFNHDSDRVIGKWIHLEETEKGLEVVGELTPGHSDAENIKASMKHGAMDGLSIGFYIPEDGSERKKDGGRIIKEIELIEISVVSRPADDHARISAVKSRIDDIENIRDAEDFLRESANFSKSAAISFVSRFKNIVRSESVQAERITSNQKDANTLRLTNCLRI